MLDTGVGMVMGGSAPSLSAVDGAIFCNSAAKPESNLFVSLDKTICDSMLVCTCGEFVVRFASVLL